MQRPLQHMLLVPLILTSTASAYGTGASAHVTDGLETRDYNITVGGHSLKLHLLLLHNESLPSRYGS
jgi:hypothetical protein